MKQRILILPLIVLISVGIACGQFGDLVQPTPTPTQAQKAAAPPPPQVQPLPVLPAPTSTPVPAPSSTPIPAKTSTPTMTTPTVSLPKAINPLTGLPVKDANCLTIAPAMVSISNFPAVYARPQSGLSYSPFVFEYYAGAGDSRFLALFFCDYPQAVIPKAGGTSGSSGTGGSSNSGGTQVTVADIGPIRSGRIFYESLRKLYNGFLVMAGAWYEVFKSLNNTVVNVGEEKADGSGHMMKVADLEKAAQANPERLASDLLGVYTFTGDAPAGGKPGIGAWMAWNFLNQSFWRYDPASGSYNRYQDNSDGTNFILATDKLTGERLTYENVVFLYTRYHVYADTLIDMELLFINREKALVFRDGKMYDVFWTTLAGDMEKKTGKARPIRFVNADGSPFPLKPGQTWVYLMPVANRYYETEDTKDWYRLNNLEKPGTGFWAIRFERPALEKRP